MVEAATTSCLILIMTLTIKTNNQARDLFYWNELPESVQSEFNYIDEDEKDYARFFNYLGNWYYFGDILHATPDIQRLEWDGYSSDSVWSGIVVRVINHNEQVICGRYYS